MQPAERPCFLSIDQYGTTYGVSRVEDSVENHIIDFRIKVPHVDYSNGRRRLFDAAMLAVSAVVVIVLNYNSI